MLQKYFKEFYIKKHTKWEMFSYLTSSSVHIFKVWQNCISINIFEKPYCSFTKQQTIFLAFDLSIYIIMMVIFFDEENITFTCIFVIHKLFNLDLDFLKKVKIETKSWSKIPSYPFTIFILFFLFRESGKRTMDSISVQLCPLLVVPLPKLIQRSLPLRTSLPP